MEIRISSTFTLLASLHLLLASVVMADRTCYDTSGNINGNLLPCYAPGTTDLNAVTHCCKKGDMCLSNGLCLTPGSHYIMTQQGCTDKDFGKPPCNQYCKNDKDTFQGLSAIPLIACPESLTSDSPKFCCGPDASSCCQTPSSQLTIPTGTIYEATIVQATFTITPSATSDATLKLGLGIGLGLGIPILLALIAVAYFLARPRYYGGGGGSSSQRHLKPGRSTPPGGKNNTKRNNNHHYRNYSTTPSRNNDKDGRRDSFGRVDTNVGPPSDDGNWDGTAAAAWPPNGTNNVAAAIAAWALNQNNPPPSPKEMDAGRISRSRIMRRGETPTKFPVELPAHPDDDLEPGVMQIVGVREIPLNEEGGGMMELPTPDYEAHPVGGYPLPPIPPPVLDEPDPETHTRSTTVQIEGDGLRSAVGDQVSPLTISSPAVLSPVTTVVVPPPPVLAEGVRGERSIKMIDIRIGRKKGSGHHHQQHE
ncbi:hypothetical protein QBC38DRAFT_176596 [Podospora fimiseda]|uniref:Mid2 domain-containing protein n=1 Tax=Podospora fimiseda TaxID=252190 RepID=A0AAN7BY80_9PEZI|nr:hypothetical protein QBC38DRAFT_176596 [Podospora fimiseda]